MPRFNRRKFLITAGAATAGTFLLHSCGQGNDQAQFEVEIDPEDAPETPTARLGFIALTDSAPLIIAREKGFFC